MELSEVIEKRRSIREYKPDPVPGHLVQRIIDLAKQGPSAGAIRGYEIVVSDQHLTVYNAPVSLVVCALPGKYTARYGQRGKDLYSVQDATIVAAYIQLIAIDLGLDTVWVGAFRESGIREALDLPGTHRPIAIIQLGYRV